MILAIDVGNTNIVVGAYQDEKVLFVSRIATDATKTEDEYAALIKSVISLHHEEVSAITGAMISSVVPPITALLKKAVLLFCGVDALVVGPGIKTGLNIKIDNPAQLGSDFVATAVAALAFYPTPCLVIDLGTATKFSALDKNGAMIGGSIMPGVRIALNALSSGTAQLPHIALDTPPSSVIGTNSIDCMTSGVIYGNASMVDGMIERHRAVLGNDLTVVATGGLSGLIIPYCNSRIIYNENLLLDGLRILYTKNHK